MDWTMADFRRSLRAALHPFGGARAGISYLNPLALSGRDLADLNLPPDVLGPWRAAHEAHEFRRRTR